MIRGIVIGWLLALLTFSIGAVVGSNWYEYKMLPPGDCALFQIAQYDPGSWTVVPSQPTVCYLRRARLTLW
jgi:hypothetical protein